MSFLNYDPHNWYWQVADQSNAIYSSASNTYIDPSDADYTAWLAANNAPIPIANEAELWGVVSPAFPDRPAWLFNGTLFVQPAVGQYSKAQLISYAADARWRKQTGGITVASVDYRTDRVSSNERNTAYNYAQANSSATFQWKLPDGSFVTLDATQLSHVAVSESGFVQSCFDCEKTTGASVSSGSITDLAGVDAPFAAISNVFA